MTSEEQRALLGDFEAEVLIDVYPGRGPLGGIYTGLLASRYAHSLVVACDMPFLNTELLRYMVGLSPGFDVVIPRIAEGMVEPLHALYSKGCLDSMKALLGQDKLKIGRLFGSVRVKYVEPAECRRFDPQLLTFFNINDQSDLDRALALAAENDL